MWMRKKFYENQNVFANVNIKTMIINSHLSFINTIAGAVSTFTQHLILNHPYGLIIIY